MDVESVRSGHSQRSDRSRRSQFAGGGGGGGGGFPRSRLPPHSGATVPAVATFGTSLASAPPVANSGPAPAFFHPGSRLATPQHSGAGIAYVPPTALFSAPRNAVSSSLLAPGGGPGPGPGPGPAYHALVPQQHLVAMDGEQIEVQILPQAPGVDPGGEPGPDWADATTAVTSDTGTSYDGEAGVRPGLREVEAPAFDCARSMGAALAVCLGVVAYLSPVAMVVLPRLALVEWRGETQCGSPCFAQMVGLSFKLLILLLATWALFFRPGAASMPRVYCFRALVLFLVFVVTFAFWLFYGVRVLEQRREKYHNIVLFAVSLVDTLLFIHYLAVVLLELRHLEPRYSVRVVRSPDGEAHSYRLGEISVQRAAVHILQRYMTDFQVYNPYLEAAIYRRSRAHQLRGGKSSHTASTATTAITGGSAADGPQYKFYDVDTGAAATGNSQAAGSSSGARARGGATERFYDEMDYEKRLRKRRVRLVTAVEEAFAHIRRVGSERTAGKPLDPHEAAQAVFPTLLKPLQKYLRLTRQQPRYTMEMVIQHLATCIAHDMGPRAFADKYLSQGPVVEDAKGYRRRHAWTLLSSTLLSRGLADGCVFQLRQAEVSLLCTVRRLPFFSVAEELLDPKRNKFVLQINSETSV